MIAAPLSPALSCLKLWASSLLNSTTINITTVQIKHIFLNFTQIVFFVFHRTTKSKVGDVSMYNLLLQLLFQSTVYNRKQEFREHRRHVKDQHTFTFGRVPVEWRLVRLQHTVVDCINYYKSTCGVATCQRREKEFFSRPSLPTNQPGKIWELKT